MIEPTNPSGCSDSRGLVETTDTDEDHDVEVDREDRSSHPPAQESLQECFKSQTAIKNRNKAKAPADHNGNQILDDNKNLSVKSKDEEDEEFLALSKLRCTSLQTEEIASREKAKQDRERRRQERSKGYPGLAFGSAMFGSDTMMKFNIIKNELHNIMKSQLKRVDGEVTALSKRVKALDENLEKSESYIRSATIALSEAVQLELESRKECQEEEEEEDALSQFDAQMKLLEGKLAQARLLVEEARQVDVSGVWKQHNAKKETKNE